jgi:hypothetical protein
MAHEYVAPKAFRAPARTLPSADFLGEADAALIHQAVGRALSRWEHSESAWAKAFQLFCESKSLAPVRAFGTIESVASRNTALKYSAQEFFAARDASDARLAKSLLGVHLKANEYRNEVAHGMALQPHGFGYFLCPASYAVRKRKARAPYPTEQWGLGADYFYRVREIEFFSAHFEDIMTSVMSLVLYLNGKYKIISPGHLHP